MLGPHAVQRPRRRVRRIPAAGPLAVAEAQVGPAPPPPGAVVRAVPDPPRGRRPHRPAPRERGAGRPAPQRVGTLRAPEGGGAEGAADETSRARVRHGAGEDGRGGDSGGGNSDSDGEGGSDDESDDDGKSKRGLKILVIAPVSLHDDWRRTAEEATGLRVRGRPGKGGKGDKKKKKAGGGKKKRKKKKEETRTVTGKPRRRTAAQKGSDDEVSSWGSSSEDEDGADPSDGYDMTVLSWSSVGAHSKRAAGDGDYDHMQVRAASRRGGALFLPLSLQRDSFDTRRCTLLISPLILTPCLSGSSLRCTLSISRRTFQTSSTQKSMDSKRTREALDLMSPRRCRGALLLTGTPMKNGKPANLFPPPQGGPSPPSGTDQRR
ncbi:hypothetical protein THAOC_30348, partial [Thalassiosira oceanica]